jgi:hypothetical protein
VTPPPVPSPDEQRAEALLLRHLTPAQQKTYLSEGWFEVLGKDGSVWAVDRKGGSLNVRRSFGTETRVYCTNLTDVPRADTLLVQKLCIEATGGRGLPRVQGATLTDANLLHAAGGRGRARIGKLPPDPVDLSLAALEHRKLNRLKHAERLLRQAIRIEDGQVAADSFKRTHRRSNLALVMLRAGKLTEARRLTGEAWRLKGGQHDLTSGRILVVRIALCLLRRHRDVDLYLGQLKTLLSAGPLACPGNITPTWDIADVIGMLRRDLANADAELLVQLVSVLDKRSPLKVLEVFPTWDAAPPLPLETPWPRCDRDAWSCGAGPADHGTASGPLAAPAARARPCRP